MSMSATRWRALGSGRWLWPTTIAAGLVIGALSVLPYAYVTGPLHVLGNSAAVWLLIAFFVGILAGSPRRGAVGGAVTLLAVVTGFFVAMQLLYPADSFGRTAVFWLVAAVIGGPVFGWFGALWHRGDVPRGVTSAAMGAAFVAEALLFPAGPSLRHVLGEGLFGVLLTLGLARGRRPLIAALCAFPIFMLAGAVGWFVTRDLMHLYFYG
jgi:hypothetical protein